MLQRSSFKMVRPTNKRYLMAVDICGSMFHGRKTSGCRYLSSADASCLVLMALAQAESEKLTALAFSKDGLEEIEVSKEMSHGEVLKKLREIPMGTVDQASPLLWAKEKKKSFDVILICTDNQTQPDTHPVDAFKDYRKTMDLPQARLVMCAFSSKDNFPSDEPDVLHIAGFNDKVLHVIQNFACGIF
ncbi:RNA-binding protein RO60-like [Tachypleus tridentatus]|uniref:RNA-binding protein RO60-like n=1 Tax=Tachypleus tridentatus TaxID=6853 RepID=UPI003FD15231